MNAAQLKAASRRAHADLFTPVPAAVISPCGAYRYTLTRTWDVRRPSVVFVMLNPSTADASVDDPTVLKCMGFAQRWGHGGILVVNLFAYRATDPEVMEKVADPIGPDNLLHLQRAFQSTARVVCAWGCRKFAQSRGRELRTLLHDRGLTPDVIRFSAKGLPEHPLFLPYESVPAPWPFHPATA